MADYPTNPVNPGGGGIFWQRTDPSTWYLYNNPPPMPATTTTTLPQADAGSAYAAPMPTPSPALQDAYQAYQQQQAAQGATTGLAAMGVINPNDPALRHGQYGELRGLDQMMRQAIPPEHLYPFIQSLMDEGVLRSGEGGIGLDMSLPYGGPNAPKTQRLIDMFEQYQNYLKGGGQPVYLPTNPGPPQYDPSGGPRILGTLP